MRREATPAADTGVAQSASLPAASDRCGRRARPWRLSLLSVLLLSAQALSWAHGVDAADGDALQRATGGEWMPYLHAGFTHMIGGWDHLLFVAVVGLVAAARVEAIWGLTAFSIGHSAMLYLSTAANTGLSLPAVDLAIALTLAALAARGPMSARRRARTLWRLLLGAAGLVHGTGLAGALRARLDDVEPTLGQLVAFNLGVEGAQLTVLALLWPLIGMLRRPTSIDARRRVLLGATSLSLALVGWQACSLLRPVPPPAVPAPAEGFAWRTDSFELQLPPGGIGQGEAERAVRLPRGGTLVWSWSARVDGQRFWSDFHGVSDDGAHTDSYQRGLGAAAAGTLTAPFSGLHGWYFQNQSRQPVTVRLHLAGFYALDEPAAPESR